ncbi:MAG TPA: autotransporter-associated beta strand repeat-containing protein, partial [Chthoniobacterales bacterium]
GLGSNVFRNEGTFSKAGTSWAGISAAFTNAGRVEVSGGYTDFNGIFTGEVGSEFDVASAAAASFQYGEVRGTVVTTGAGMVRLTGTTTNQGSLTVNGASNWAGTLTGSGTTYVGSAGTMSINDQFSTANLSGHTLVNNGVVNIGATAPNQFYTSRLDLGNGATLVNQGQFNIGGTSSAEIRAFGTGSNVFVNEGTFSKVGTSAAFVSAAFTNAGTVEVNGGILTFAGSFISESGSVVRVAEDRVAVVDGIVSGVISDPGAGGNLPQLTKDGAGSLTLTNANTYEGGTLVEEGSLFANNGTNGSATGAGTVTVTGTGTLLGGTGTITGPVHVGLNSRITGGTAGDAIANPITAENVGHLTVGALTLSESSIFHVDIFSGSSFDGIAASTISMQGAFLTLNIASDATFTDGGSMILLTSLGRTGVFSGITQGMTVVTVNGFDLKADYTAGGFALNTVTAVPEPSTWMGAGMLLGLASWCLRKRKSSRFANA